MGEVETPNPGDGRGREALPECLEGLGGIGRPFLRVGKGWQDLTEGRKGSGDPP